METVGILNKELEAYDKKLTEKPAILLFNKIDLVKNIAVSTSQVLKIILFQQIDLLTKRFREPDWHLDLPDSLRPNRPIRFDYVLQISARKGDIQEVKKALHRLHNELNPNFAGSINLNSNTKQLL